MKNYTLITGATGGIGIELATVFAKNNHNLILTGTSRTKLEQLKKHLNSQYDVDIYTID
jgi:short-subunit dehydrogenase